MQIPEIILLRDKNTSPDEWGNFLQLNLELADSVHHLSIPLTLMFPEHTSNEQRLQFVDHGLRIKFETSLTTSNSLLLERERASYIQSLPTWLL